VKRQVIMAKKTMALQQWVLGGTIAAVGAVTASAAQAAPLEEFQYNPQSDQLSFVLPGGVTPRYFLMAQPARIVVDIPDTQIGDLPTAQSFAGAVKRVEVTQVQPQLARVILEMAPTAVFARGQVSFQNVGSAGTPDKDRWVLRPLLATSGSPRSGAPLAVNPATNPAAPETLAERASHPLVDKPVGKAPSSNAPRPIVPPLASANPIVAVKPQPIVKPAPAVELPPGMEGVVGASPLPELSSVPEQVTRPEKVAPVTPAPLPRIAPAPAAPTVVVRPTPVQSTPKVESPIARLSEAAPVPIARLPEAAPVLNVPPPPPLLQATIINRAPNSNSPAAQVTPEPVMRPDLRSGSSPMVSVPPLASISVPTPPPMPSTPFTAPPLPTLAPGAVVSGRSNTNELPPMPDRSLRSSGVNPAPPVMFPSSTFPSGTFGNLPSVVPITPSVAAPLPIAGGVVEFGQRRPGSPTLQAAVPFGVPGVTVVALDNLTTGGVVLPAGTLLSLRYEQPSVMKLNAGQRQQGLLSLQSPIVDARGRILAPQGSVVLGEFATSGEGSQFTTQALSVQNRSLSLLAQSDVLRSNKRVSNNQLLQNSGIGAVAGAILGGLNGSVLGGAAAGAAITYAVSPKETLLQPGQVVQVKLVQDFFAGR
jgi:hypothetical protein